MTTRPTSDPGDIQINIAFYRVSALSLDNSRPTDVISSLLAQICQLPFTGSGTRDDRYRMRDHDRRDFFDRVAAADDRRFVYVRGLGSNELLAESWGNLRTVKLSPGEAQAVQHFCLLIPDETIAVASLNQPVSPQTLTRYIQSKVPIQHSAVAISRLVNKNTIERMESYPTFTGFTFRLLPSRIEAFREEDTLLYGAAKAKQDFCGLERVIVLSFSAEKADRSRMAQFIQNNLRRWRSSRNIREATQGLTVSPVDPRTGRKMSVDVASDYLTATATVSRMATDPSLAAVDEIYAAIISAARALALDIDAAYGDATWLNSNQGLGGLMAIQNSLWDLLQEQ